MLRTPKLTRSLRPSLAGRTDPAPVPASSPESLHKPPGCAVSPRASS